MMDIDGREFSIHEHSLSPVSERTELETSSSKTSHSKRRPLVQTVLSQRLHSEHGLHPVAPLSLSPKPKHLSTPSSPSSPYRSPPASSTPSKLADRPRDSRPLSEPQKLATLPPRSSSPAQIKSTHLFSSPPGSISPGRPSIHRLPKKTSHLIQLFENSLASSSPPKLPISTSPHHTAIPSSSQPAFTTQNRSYTSIPVEHPDRGSSPHSPASPLQARNQSKFSSMDPLVGRSSSPHLRSPNVSLRASSPHSPGLNSMDRLDPTSLPAPSMTEMECLRHRQERRERIAMAVKNHTPHSPSRLKINDATSKLDISSPRSDHPLKHRKSVASSLTSRISDRVLHAGTIWYRNPKANRWRETRGILTPEALYLMNEHGEVDPNVPDQSIELSLSGCTSVESVRSKRSYGPDFSEPHLHILRIAWAEFDPRTNSRIEYEEFLGCGRATQRADWVGAIWQAAHDQGGFVDQPDIPLRGKPSPTIVQPRSIISSTQTHLSPSLPHSQPPNADSSTSSPQQVPSPKLNPVVLMDRSLSVDPGQVPEPSPPATTPSLAEHHLASPSHSGLPPASIVSSCISEASTPTTNLHSEVDRDLFANQQVTRSPVLSSTRFLYNDVPASSLEETVQETHDPELAQRHYPIDPNLERNPTRPKTPELDIFAMLDRMSVCGSIHRSTAAFYDPSPPDCPQAHQSDGILNPQPISANEQADISALERDANHARQSPSNHSYRTMRPTSAAGFYDRVVNSPRSSPQGPRPSDNEHLSEVMSIPKPHGSSTRPLSLTPTNVSYQPAHLNSQLKPPSNLALPEPKRGAWSDTDRLSNQTDNVLTGSNPARAVQRDLRRILKTIERNDSHRADQSDSLGQYLDSIQHQLQNVATKLRGHQFERESNYPVNESDEPTIADKVDYMLSLCNVLLESQHKVSSAVEKNLRAHGVSISHRSAHPRSMSSNTHPSRRHSRNALEPGMPGPAPLTPHTEPGLDNDAPSSSSRTESPPLPPLPEDTDALESSQQVRNLPTNPPEVLPPVAVQEAGLDRIENLLVALLARMDESSQRQQSEPPPPVPDKDTPKPGLEDARQSGVRTDSQSDTFDLDADVALWKSKGKGISLSDGIGAWNEEQRRPLGQSVASHAASVYPPTELEAPASDQLNPHLIPDYNLAYEAEDAVARRIADERARAARRLEGVSTPFGYRQSFPVNTLAFLDNPRVPSQAVEPMLTVPPNQDHHVEDTRRQTTQTIGPQGSVPEQSYWSSTTPTVEEQAESAPPPPPKDGEYNPHHLSQAAPSVREPIRVASEAVSHQSAARPLSLASRPASAAPPPISQPHISPEEIRTVVQEALQHHSTEQAPVLEEVVTLLRTQDQVNQASVLNQAEVSRYLGQLNVHLEGVLHKKTEEIQHIGENVLRLEKQLAILLEQSEKISSAIPIINSIPSTSAPPAEQAPTCIDQLDEVAHQTYDAETEAEARKVTDNAAPDGPVDVSVQPPGGDGLEVPSGTDEPHVTLMSKKPSVGYRITGPRARKLSFNKGLKGPRMPSGLATVGKLWGGPVPAADRAARWGTGGGSLKRIPTKVSHVSDNPTNVEGALSAINPDDPVGQEALSQMDATEDDKAGTIALGISHILKFLRENSEKEELRRQKKEAEKAAQPQPAIPDEMEQRRAKIEELQLRREATLADDKAKQMQAMMQAMKQQAAEHDRLLKKIVEEVEAQKATNPEGEAEERKRRYEEAMEGVHRVLATVESGVLSHLEDFKSQMFNEMKTTFEKVGELREQKQQIQADIADMLSYMSKVRGGAPDPRWQFPSPVASVHGGGAEGSVAGGGYQPLLPIPETYPSPHVDHPIDREGTEIDGGVARSVAGFGPRPPGRR